MILFNVHELYMLAVFLSAVDAIVDSLEGKDEKISEAVKQTLLEKLGRMEKLCDDIGLELASTQIERVRTVVTQPDVKFPALLHPLRDLEGRVHDELRLNLFMAIPRDRADYYDKPILFGQAVADKFPDATYDIGEAGSSYATDRYTACVMHLMRSLEVALDAIGLGVGLPDAVIEARNSWESLLKKVRKQIEANDASGDPAWQPKRQFFVDAEAHLYAVKNAWRNPSMHLEKKYDDKEALRIYNAVKDFMEHLATHLDASGQFTP
jgi:hypothetical protein